MPSVQTLVDVPQEITPMWYKLMNEPLDAVRERVSVSGVVSQEELDEVVTEYRKFLGLVLLGNGGLAMTSEKVDEVWHNHILFTRDYADFCDDVFGGYLHHMPNTSFTPITPGGGKRFREAYRQTYGEVPMIWGGQVQSMCLTSPPMCDTGGKCDMCKCEEVCKTDK